MRNTTNTPLPAMPSAPFDVMVEHAFRQLTEPGAPLHEWIAENGGVDEWVGDIVDTALGTARRHEYAFGEAWVEGDGDRLRRLVADMVIHAIHACHLLSGTPPTVKFHDFVDHEALL